jgi:hypothetical protein
MERNTNTLFIKERIMKNFSVILFWIFTDILLVFGFAFLPSVFSIFCFIAAIIFAPIEEWQNLLKKFFKKPIKSIIIAIIVAVIIAEFPISRVVNGINDVVNPPPTSSNFEVYYEEPETTTTSEFKASSNTYSKKLKASSKVNNTTSNNYNSHTTSYEENYENSNEESTEYESDIVITNSDYVYRTPSGKRYHTSPTCGGKNSYEVSYEEAIDDGLTPCQKCAEE